MNDKILNWEEYKETIPVKERNIFKKNKILFMDKGHFITYLILLIVSLTVMIGCFYIPNSIARNCLICLSTGLFASMLISGIFEIINNKRIIAYSVQDFNNFLYYIYTNTLDLATVSDIKETLITRECRTRYNKTYGASGSYEPKKMARIEAKVRKEYDNSNINNIPSAKTGLGIMMFEVSKSITYVTSSIDGFKNKYATIGIYHFDILRQYEKKLLNWSKAIQCFIYRFAEPNVNYFQNIAAESKQFIDTNFIKDNYLK